MTVANLPVPGIKIESLKFEENLKNQKITWWSTNVQLSRPGNSKSQLKIHTSTFFQNPKNLKISKIKIESKIEFQNVNKWRHNTNVFVLREKKEREYFYCVLRMRSPILMSSCTFWFLFSKIEGGREFCSSLPVCILVCEHYAIRCLMMFRQFGSCNQEKLLKFPHLPLNHLQLFLA